MPFPDEFAWGAAAASYQIEGAAREGGRGPSVWDAFCRRPGAIRQGDTGDVACDHYHRYADDARLMGTLGLKAYRFSIAWPRVLPGGTGPVNERGLDFYDRLVDALLANGVSPWATLFHWDYPRALFRRGGWLARESADWFAEYAAVVVDRLSDRVSHWITQNEPQCYIGLGHRTGEHAPGLRLDLPDVLRAAHHSLLAHGRTVQVIRARARTAPVVGAAPVGIVFTPASERREDIDAARARTFAVVAPDTWSTTWFADPMLLGSYPADGLRLFGEDAPRIEPGDLETIRQPLDFYGVNIYFGQRIRAAPGGGWALVPEPPGPALTTMGWRVDPEVLYWGPRFLYERYGLPIVITENGMANCDWIHADGAVHDPQRIDYLARHLRACAHTIRDGVDVRGYFVWSILDNFEWAFGYTQRFGLVFVDYPTQRRI
ncbi:MAG: beta-glucosidase, partial [Planctomycetes bacterium]|nr:beta-glucosidase [Planctomycetota bacterium]